MVPIGPAASNYLMATSKYQTNKLNLKTFSKRILAAHSIPKK